MEYRNFAIRSSDTDGLKLYGYAARYNSRSLPMRDAAGAEFVEEIAYGAFDRSLQNPDVSFLWQHDSKMPLASTLSGTLNLRSDKDGLTFEANLPDTQLARDAVTLVRAGVVRKMSFGFFVREEDKSKPGVRILRDLDLREISLVERAAYPAAGATARSLPFTKKQRYQTLLRLRRAPK
jgi:HK97 family phage prohead protease